MRNGRVKGAGLQIAQSYRYRQDGTGISNWLKSAKSVLD